VTAIQREKCPDDKNMRAYHSRVKLSSDPLELLLNGMRSENEIPSEIVNMPGVNSVEAYVFMIVVRKSPAFEWEEIEPNILRILAAFNMPLEGSKLHNQI